MSFLFDVHAPSTHLCVAYTAILLLQLPWPEPSWFYALWFAVNWPTFGPKGRPKATGQDKEIQLQNELRDFLEANDGVRPGHRTPLYQKIRRAGLLHLLNDVQMETPEQREVRLRQELELFLEQNHGTRPGSSSTLYQKLQRNGLLNLLQDVETETQEQREVRLRHELELFLENQGTRPGSTSPLYQKLKKMAC